MQHPQDVSEVANGLEAASVQEVIDNSLSFIERWLLSGRTNRELTYPLECQYYLESDVLCRSTELDQAYFGRCGCDHSIVHGCVLYGNMTSLPA